MDRALKLAAFVMSHLGKHKEPPTIEMVEQKFGFRPTPSELRKAVERATAKILEVDRYLRSIDERTKGSK